MPVHLIKLAVGARAVADIRRWQAARARDNPPLRHPTRNYPRRAEELLDGGSIYWVVDGIVSVRQRLAGIAEGTREDGTPCTDLLLRRALVLVVPRPMRPFQGWRYLEAEDAPADLPTGGTRANDLPEDLRRDLARLALL